STKPATSARVSLLSQGAVAWAPHLGEHGPGACHCPRGRSSRARPIGSLHTHGSYHRAPCKVGKMDFVLERQPVRSSASLASGTGCPICAFGGRVPAPWG